MKVSPKVMKVQGIFYVKMAPKKFFLQNWDSGTEVEITAHYLFIEGTSSMFRQVDAWQSAPLRQIGCTSVQPVPAWVEEPSIPTRV